MRLAACAKVDAGVAWVRRAVVTIPVAMPASRAREKIVGRLVSGEYDEQLLSFTRWSTATVRELIFVPVKSEKDGGGDTSVQLDNQTERERDRESQICGLRDKEGDKDSLIGRGRDR